MTRLDRLFGGEPKEAQYKITDTYARLRKQALELKPEQMGFGTDQRIAGVVMEKGFPEGVMTMVALADGTASLYFSGGGGFVGVGEHAGPNAAARSLVAKASDFESACVSTADFPMPQTGYTRFYLIKHDGVLTAEIKEKDLSNGRHRFSPLFHAAHELVTQVRLIDEKLKSEKQSQDRQAHEPGTGIDNRRHPGDQDT